MIKIAIAHTELGSTDLDKTNRVMFLSVEMNQPSKSDRQNFEGMKTCNMRDGKKIKFRRFDFARGLCLNENVRTH